jgi:hypothetical protein
MTPADFTKAFSTLLILASLGCDTFNLCDCLGGKPFLTAAPDYLLNLLLGAWPAMLQYECGSARAGFAFVSFFIASWQKV